MTLTMESAVKIMDTAQATIEDTFEDYWTSHEALCFRRPLEAIMREHEKGSFRTLCYLMWTNGSISATRVATKAIARENAEALTFLNVDKFPGTKGAA